MAGLPRDLDLLSSTNGTCLDSADDDRSSGATAAAWMDACGMPALKGVSTRQHDLVCTSTAAFTRINIVQVQSSPHRKSCWHDIPSPQPFPPIAGHFGPFRPATGRGSSSRPAPMA